MVRKNKNTAVDYFLAGRNLSWWIVGASIFASNIGSEHIVGLAGSGATDGVAMAHYELHAWCLLVLAWVFVPFYMRSMVFTMPEFLEKRFSTSSRYVLSIVSLITFIVSKIAVGIFAGGVVFATLLPELQINDRHACHIDSFWIGSVLGHRADRPLHDARRHARVAYNDAVQVVRSDRRLGAADVLRADPARRLAASARDLRLRDVQPVEAADPAGVEGTWAPVHRAQRRRPGGASGVVLQRQLPVARHGCSARRSSACGIGAPTSTSSSARSARRTRQTRGAAASSRRS